MLASIIIRTLNEAVHLDSLLQSIASQRGIDREIIVVDSGSTDGTLEIAARRGCSIRHITREEFSFGRSLNIGCEAAVGDILVLVSGHCVPTGETWLENLCRPIVENRAEYSYGRQIGGPDSHYSECRIFAKYYPTQSRIPQVGFFCNNANAALSRTAWLRHGFDEDLTGLEDMDLAKRLVATGSKVAYVAEACVYHYHNETWKQVKRRFEREAIALQHILPQIHIRNWDFLRYVVSSIWLDWRSAWNEGRFAETCMDIVRYRFWQYWGSYRGNHDHRKLSHAEKEKYFFPSDLHAR